MGVRAGIFKQAGVSVVSLPGGEIVPSLERGVIDAAEYSDFWADSAMGFADVSKYVYFTRYPMGGHLYLFINQDKWKQLPSDLKEAVESASRDAAEYNITHAVMRNLIAWEKSAEKGLKIEMLPNDVEKHMDTAAKAYYKEQCAKDPLFNKVLTSMEKFSKKYNYFETIAAESILSVQK
jgi:TRAP-type mannitol/chloroaromatic compound transport system substrate-binding protein